MAERILREAQQSPDLSIDELNARADRATAAYNARPQDALGGLSPNRAARLLAPDWDARHAMRLNQSLSWKDVQAAATVLRARELCAAAIEHDGLPATERGNLKRSVVAELMDGLPWDAEYVELVRSPRPLPILRQSGRRRASPRPRRAG